ncbi:unnamed protein product [Polarella glacialis]|uniref:WD repeat-containing protein 55 n=1 Tax=Polarella glacialis TaxID=89957 RepID=A0A813FZF5_POLGL|nr:unnamed protein product [Polarella glacialis]
MASCLLSISTEAHTFDAQFHPSEPILAMATVTGEVEVHRFDLVGGTSEVVRKIASHEDSCRTARFLGAATGAQSASSSSFAQASSASSAALMIATASADCFTALSDLETGKRVWRSKLPGAGNALLPLAGSDRFVVGDDSGGVLLFDSRDKKLAASWSENADFISDMALGVDGYSLCATSGDGTLAVYDLRKNGVKGLIAMSDFQEDELLSVAIVKGGKKVVCGSQTGILSIFSWGDFGDQKDRIKGHPMSVDAMLKLTEEGLLTGCSDGKIRVVATNAKNLQHGVMGVLAEHGDFPIEQLALSPDGKLLASVSHNQPAVKLWSTEAAHQLLSGEVEKKQAAEGEDAQGAEVDSDDSDEDTAPNRKARRRQQQKEKQAKKRARKGGTNHNSVVKETKQKAGSFFGGL